MITLQFAVYILERKISSVDKQHQIPTKPLRTYTSKLEKYVKTIFLSDQDGNRPVHDTPSNV
jgi:hypothetical protein